MTHTYRTQGTCAKLIEIELDDNEIVQSVKFTGGCNGNTQGIGLLVKGMPAKEVISRLENVKCGFKSTSCPDQLAKALKEIVK